MNRIELRKLLEEAWKKFNETFEEAGISPKELVVSYTQQQTRLFAIEHGIIGEVDRERLLEILKHIPKTELDDEDKEILLLYLEALSNTYINKHNKGFVATFPNFICLVPTSSTNGHNYPLGEVCFASPLIDQVSSGGKNDIFLKQNGRKGNHLNTRFNDWRIATDEEIREYFDSLEESKPEVFNRVIQRMYQDA